MIQIQASSEVGEFIKSLLVLRKQVTVKGKKCVLRRAGSELYEFVVDGNRENFWSNCPVHVVIEGLAEEFNTLTAGKEHEPAQARTEA